MRNRAQNEWGPGGGAPGSSGVLYILEQFDGLIFLYTCIHLGRGLDEHSLSPSFSSFSPFFFSMPKSGGGGHVPPPPPAPPLPPPLFMTTFKFQCSSLLLSKVVRVQSKQYNQVYKEMKGYMHAMISNSQLYHQTINIVNILV